MEKDPPDFAEAALLVAWTYCSLHLCWTCAPPIEKDGNLFPQPEDLWGGPSSPINLDENIPLSTMRSVAKGD